MKFCKAFEALFSEDELKYVVKEASLCYENENNEVDYILLKVNFYDPSDRSNFDQDSCLSSDSHDYIWS